MTVSFSKSISVLHASIRENGRRARLAGDQAAAVSWAVAEQDFQEILQAANRAGLAYVLRWAGITRTSYHGARVDDREPGKYEEALITVTSWLQGTSLDGDPRDHIHNQIVRMVKTVSDGSRHHGPASRGESAGRFSARAPMDTAAGTDRRWRRRGVAYFRSLTSESLIMPNLRPSCRRWDSEHGPSRRSAAITNIMC